MGKNNGSKSIDRRKVLKTAAAGGILGSGLVATVATASESEGSPVSPKETTPPNPGVQVTKVDRSVKGAVPHWDMLTLSEETIVRYIRQSDYSQDQKREARDALRDLRRKFPVRREQNGNVTWLKLATDRTATQKDNSQARTVHRLFADGTGGGAVETQFYGSLHEEQAREACDEMGIGGTSKDDIVKGSDDPDNPDVDIQVPDGIMHEQTVEDGLEKGLNYLLRYYGQYFDPGVFEIYHDDNHDVDFGEIGGAPDAAGIEFSYAEKYDSDLYLGRTSHYFSDMGVPLHTGMGWEQVNLEIYTNSDGNVDYRIDPMYWLHGEYEEYVSDNWDSGEWFQYQFNSNNCSADYCYYPLDTISGEIKNLADYTEDYSYDVYSKILDEGQVDWTDWSSNTKDYMQDITENSVHEMGLYFRGLLEEMH